MLKAASLYQPYASLIALGYKNVETRSWATNHRGPLAIHATQREPDWCQDVAERPGLIRDALNRHGLTFDALPRGGIVAVAELYDLVQFRANEGTGLDAPAAPIGYVRFVKPKLLTEMELACGDYDFGRYGWLLRNVQALPELVPCSGRQRLWNVPFAARERLRELTGRGFAEEVPHQLPLGLR